MSDAHDLQAFSLLDIKERLDLAQRLFSQDHIVVPEDGWQEARSKRRSWNASHRARSKHSTNLSGNAALVKGMYVVAMGWRCAYLVDTIAINKNQVEILGGYFGSVPLFGHIAFLWEEDTGQVYIVNLPIFQARIKSLQRPNRSKNLKDAEMLWLQVDEGKPCIPCEMPRSLQTQIDKQMDLYSNAMIPSPPDRPSEDTLHGLIRIKVNPKDLPALSAWILEYPIGYTFSAALSVQGDDDDQRQTDDEKEKAAGMQKTNLDGEPLVLVKVKISGDRALGDKYVSRKKKNMLSLKQNSYDLLAFSYPAHLLEISHGEEGGLTKSLELQSWLDDVPRRLRERYVARSQVRKNRVQPVIDVFSERVRLEKVVL